jgi:hypothetical protein
MLSPTKSGSSSAPAVLCSFAKSSLDVTPLSTNKVFNPPLFPNWMSVSSRSPTINVVKDRARWRTELCPSNPWTAFLYVHRLCPTGHLHDGNAGTRRRGQRPARQVRRRCILVCAQKICVAVPNVHCSTCVMKYQRYCTRVYYINIFSVYIRVLITEKNLFSTSFLFCFFKTLLRAA